MPFGFSRSDRIFERFERELSEAEVDLSALGDVNGDGATDFSLSIKRITEFSFNTPFGAELSWSISVDRDFILSSGESRPQIRDLNRFATIDGPVVETVGLGDINGDGLDDFATLTGNGNYYGYYGSETGYYGLEPRGFYGNAIDEVYITLGGVRQDARTAGEVFGIDGNVVSVKSLGDVNGDGLVDLTISTGAFYGNYYGQDGYYGRELDQTFLVLGGTGAAPIGLTDLAPDSTVLNVEVLGDLNNDGFADLAVTLGGFYGSGDSNSYYGEVREDVLVVLGGDGDFAAGQSLTEAVDTDGRALSAQGIDLNGDGFSDLLVQVGSYYGVPDPDQAGYYGYYGLEVTDVFLLLGGDPVAPVSLGGLTRDDRTVREIYDLGDINGDGLSDIGLGVVGYYGTPGLPDGYYGYYGSEIEDVLVVFGNSSGAVRPINLSDFIGIDDPLKGAIALGDINGDGFADFGVSSYYGVNGFNESTIILGGGQGATSRFALRDFGLSETLFSSIIALGDTNGDGFDDFSIQGYYGAYYGYYGDGYYGDNALGLSAYVVYGGETEASVAAFAQNARLSDGVEVIASLDFELFL